MKTSDGSDLAYTLCGEGHPVLMIGPDLFHNVRTLWHQYPDWMQGLASRVRLICLDQRGWGHSSRNLPPGLTSDRLDLDIEELVDHLGFDQIAFFSSAISGHRAVRFAVKHARRVKALIWMVAHRNMSAWPPSLFYEFSQQNWDMFLSSLIHPGLPIEEHQTWLNDFRENITLEDFRRLIAIYRDSDIEADLPKVQAPTLLLFPRNYRAFSPQEGMKVASLIPDARFVLVDGTAMLDNAMQGLGAIDAFLEDLASTEDSNPPAGIDLSKRELEVLRLVATGKSNEDIAEELVISRNTVRRHVSNIFDKIGVANRAQAVVYARDNGLA